jgi:hypothetical protein
MGTPFLARRTVEDAAVDLIRAVNELRRTCIESDHIAAMLEARWAANRAARADQYSAAAQD